MKQICAKSDHKDTKNQRKVSLNDMINKVEFTVKNHASNAGVLLLLNLREVKRIFQELTKFWYLKIKAQKN